MTTINATDATCAACKHRVLYNPDKAQLRDLKACDCRCHQPWRLVHGFRPARKRAAAVTTPTKRPTKQAPTRKHPAKKAAPVKKAPAKKRGAK